MRMLVIADIHSNQEALDSVLAAVRRKRFDRVLVLGDLVGYGAAANSVVDRMRKVRNAAYVRGNHDKVASGVENGEHFNEAARTAAFWTRENLTPQNRRFLEGLPRGPVEVAPGLLICHGAPHAEDAYLFSDFDAMQAFRTIEFDVCFFGHSHYPCAFVKKGERVHLVAPRGVDEFVLDLEPGTRYLINPGSVGQPRDRDPRTGYGILDTDSSTFRFFRREYDYARTMKRIQQAALPAILANRLAQGA